MACVFDELQMPTAVRERIGATRPIDGQLEDSWDGYTVRWWMSDDEASVIVRED